MPLPDTIRILGIPWRVSLVDIVDDEPDQANAVETDTCSILLADWLNRDRRSYHLFWAIMRALDEDLTWGDGAPTPTERDATAIGLFAALTDNWATIRRWFGLDGKPPEVEDCTLHLYGMTVRLLRPTLVPGEGSTMLGRCVYRDNTLYVRRGLSPEKAAFTALHELMHFVVWAGCHRLGEEEAFIRPMSLGLGQVIVDNPEAMRYLFDEEADPA